MKKRMNLLLTIGIIILSILLLISVNIHMAEKCLISITTIASICLIIALYQKYLKNEISYKIDSDIIFIAIISTITLLINIFLKSDPLMVLLEIISITTFHLSLVKIYKSEKYIATILLTICSIFFINNTWLIYPSITFTSVFLLYTLDKSAIYRKKNFIIITLIEIILTYFFATNYYFGFLCLIFVYHLIEKLSPEIALKLSKYGIICSIAIVLISLFIDLPFINIITDNTSNSYFITIIIITIVSCIIDLIFESDLIEKELKVISFISLLLCFLLKDSNQLITSYTILIILLFSSEIKKIPYSPKIKISNKSNLNKDTSKYKKVSAVIPNYNYENYLEERIDSILFQSYPINELIVLDDVSKDNSVEVIKNKLAKVKEKYPNLKTKFIPNKKNSGNVFKQWKKCFEVSSGDYLWICEADDSASPYFLENVMKAFEKDNKVLLSYSESLTIDENNKMLMGNLREWIDIYKTDKWKSSFIDDGKIFNKEYLIVNNTIANVSGVVFKKEDKIPYDQYLKEAENYRLAGDWYFYEKILDYGKIAYCRKSLNYHRMHSSSVTLTTSREKEYEEIYKIQEDMLKRYKIDQVVFNRIKERRDKIKYDYGFCDEELKLSKMSLSEIIENKIIKEDILLSIIIPVYNTEPFLERCLTSVLSEIPERTEIIIINDGSPDNSEVIIKKFEKKYPSIIKYYKKTNGGLSDTKNYGLKKAKGKYIGFVDSDDFIKTNMFSCMIKKALINDSDMVYCDVELVYEDGSHRYNRTTNYDISDKFMAHLDTSLMPASWNKITKKELFKGLEYPKGYNNEDIAVSPILFGRSKRISKIDSAFYKYFQRSGSIQNSGFSEKRFVVFYTAKLCFERAKSFKKSIQEKIKGSIYTHQLFGLLFYLIPKEKDKEKRLLYIQKFINEIMQFEDFDKNKYLIDYIKSFNKEKIFKYIKENKVEKIDSYVKNCKKDNQKV